MGLVNSNALLRPNLSRGHDLQKAVGGTKDVAILSASNRMSLMPFVQISTRIGGASTVILATILLRIFA
nr:2-hydroxycarboxylate transporter family protein [Pseudomonas sp. B21-040]